MQDKRAPISLPELSLIQAFRHGLGIHGRHSIVSDNAFQGK